MAEIRQLRYFVAVAERGSVSQAALDLHLSQSALSEAVRKLEVELGVQLLMRSSRGVSVTPAGDVLVGEAREAIARFDAALAAVREAADGQTGRLRVGFEAAGAGSSRRALAHASSRGSRTCASSRGATTGAARSRGCATASATSRSSGSRPT